MGFIEETGAAQHRATRASPDLRGTTGIQANDLIGRKVLCATAGCSMQALVAQIDAVRAT